MSDQATPNRPDPAEVKFAYANLRSLIASARETRQDVRRSLRERVMTISAGAIALSLLALQVGEQPSWIHLIKLSWGALLTSIVLGFVSLIVEYKNAVRTEQSTEASNKLTYEITDEKSIEEAKRLNKIYTKWNRSSIIIIDWSVYLGLVPIVRDSELDSESRTIGTSVSACDP